MFDIPTATMPEDKPAAPMRSPDIDVSPTSQPTPKTDYFVENKDDSATGEILHRMDAGGGVCEAAVDGMNDATLDLKGKGKELDNSDASATDPADSASPGSSEPPSRKTSLSSVVTFRHPRMTLPQGLKKPHAQRRIRDASPPHARFDVHVGFDNIPLGESTDYNPISFTLNHRHNGFQFSPRHRTFMVGVDDNAYSDHALQWLLDELVDDGDEIVCVRVIEATVRSTNKAYQDEANALMHTIQSKNTQNHAIGLTLEYAVGKLHNTFQHLIKIYQPSMLIVGTKGRSLEGVQGFLVNRNSFSKYCLQYSPVPVVVVRPTEKREKKKAKRKQDPSRNSYLQILGGAKHEADSENSSVYEMEPKLTAEEEAHRVAAAMGLPAAFDPTVKPIDPQAVLSRTANRRCPTVDATATQAVALAATARFPEEPAEKNNPDSEGEGSDEEEFEVNTGEEALRKERLHDMEVSEGAALRKETRKMSVESIDVEDEDEGGAKTENG